MANIRIDVPYTITDGSEVSFTAPCDCTAVEGLTVYHPGGSKVFTFRDAHGNDLTGIGNLFESGAIVKALLDVKNGRAYLQNADTNAYLEALFEGMVKKAGDTLTGSLTMEATPSGGQGYIVTKTVNGVKEKFQFYISSSGLPSVAFFEDGTEANRMVLDRNNTKFTKPVNIAGGGTDATNAEDARANLGAASAVALDMGTFETEVAFETALDTLLASMENLETKTIVFVNKGVVATYKWFGVLAKASAASAVLTAHSTYKQGSAIEKIKLSNVWYETKQGNLTMQKVWENASLTSDFAAQKVPLTLSSGDAVYVEAVRSTDDGTISGRTLVYVGGPSGYLMGTTDQFALTRRKVTASTTGVTFTAFSSANTTDGTTNEIPYRIYLVKGVSK